jgi:hypothetical protein
MRTGTKEVVMGRRAAWILGVALAVAIYATPASAQVSIAVGVGGPGWGGSVVVGGPPVYAYPYYVPYAPYPYPYYAPYYYYPYAVPYGRVYYRGGPYYNRGGYYRGGPYYNGGRYYSRGPARPYPAGAARAYRPVGQPAGRVSPGPARYAAASHRR